MIVHYLIQSMWAISQAWVETFSLSKAERGNKVVYCGVVAYALRAISDITQTQC